LRLPRGLAVVPAGRPSSVGVGVVVLLGVVVATASAALVVGGGRRAGVATSADGSVSVRKRRERSGSPQVADRVVLGPCAAVCQIDGP
jgi:hypothetical protein